MKKLTSLVALVLALVMIFAACGGNKNNNTTTPTGGTTAGTTNGTTSGTTSGTSTTTGNTSTTGGTVDPNACAHAYTTKVLTQVTTTADGKIEKTCTLCGEKVEETLPAVKKLRVLAIGNSFSVDAMEHLAIVAKAAGIEEIILGNMYIGGCSIQTHVGNINTNAANYTYYKNTGDGWTEDTNETLYNALVDEDWDIVTIQQVSQDSGKPETFELLGTIIDYVKETTENENIKIYWHMTWAYQQNYNDTNKFGSYNNDQMTMYNAIVNAVKSEILGNSSFTGFIPSGTAVQNLRTSYFGDTLTRDGFHMSYGIGRYTAALMWLKQLTGLDIDGIEAIPGAYPEIVEHLATIKEAVNAAYANPFGVTQSTHTEYVNKDLEMTDADKAYLEGLGKDPAKYTVLDLGYKFSSYWDSSKANKTPVSTAANSTQFITTDIFTTFDLPAGTVIYIKEGYQYRPEGWVKLATAHSETATGTTRPANSTESMIVDDTWFTTFNFRAFNISKVDGTDVVYDDRLALRVYVPIVEEAEESKELTDDDKAYLTGIGLNPDNYEKVILDYTPFSYYNSTSTTTSTLLCLENGTVANNLHNFLGTRLIEKAEIPTGSIIRVDDGYQYRPERFVTLGVKPTARGVNTTDAYVYVNNAWWGVHNYVGFNVAVKGNTATVSMETGEHFVIYALKAGKTPVNPGGTTEEPETPTLPTVVTDKSITEALTDADKAFLTSQGLDPAKYAVLKMTPALHAYYNSTNGSGSAVDLITDQSNCPNFWATTEKYSAEQLPVGSVITIKDGYQYRPEGWQKLNEKNSASRLDNVITATVKVDAGWWSGYSYRAFNVAYRGTSTAVTEADFTALRIYVPIA